MDQVKKVVVGTLVSLPTLAFAVAPDFSGLTDQIDWSTAIAAILLIAGGLAGVYIVVKGAKLINAMLKGG